MKKMLNQELIQGKLFSHSLEKKIVKNDGPNKGKPFIQGAIQIQVDNEGLNVVEVYYSYIPEFTKAGKADRRFSTLSKIIDNGRTVETDGPDAAMLVSATPAIALNDYYNIEKEEFGGYPRNEGGFLNIITASDLKENEADRSRFETDVLIIGIKPVEEDEERGIEEHAELDARIFNFRGDIMPVKFQVYNPNAIKYFEGLEASTKNPVFTKIWGQVKSATIKKTVTEENAFGEAAVKETHRTIREYVVTGAITEPYAFDDEATITAAELKKALEDRETYLAKVKGDRIAYEQSKGNATGGSDVKVSNDSAFDF
jgi:hypothetical protein